MVSVTVAVATFLHGIVQSYATSLVADATDPMGIETQVVEYQGRQITYLYHRLGGGHDSVCANLRENLFEYSQCTVAAEERVSPIRFDFFNSGFLHFRAFSSTEQL